VPQQQDPVAMTLCWQLSNTNKNHKIVLNYFNFVGVVEINNREEYSNPNGVKQWYEGGHRHIITTVVYILKDFHYPNLKSHS
jgi:hypothetical protein